MRKITILFTLLLFACLQSAFAQKLVTGKVTSSEDGLGLPGVTVGVKGTTAGTITDASGSFTLSVPSKATTLTFSFIGMKTQEVEIGTKTSFTISLAQAYTEIGEVTAVGYGTAKRRDITGSVSSVSGAAIQQLSTQRVDQTLQGRSSGVTVQNTDGAPGGSTKIRIRGLNSINGGNDPLVVIDGLQDGDLNSLSPNDIDAIEILKDASATAIYGSRGANGVILITTKFGSTAKPVIDGSYNYGIQNLARKIPVMNAGDFCRFANSIRMSQTMNGNVPVPIFTDAEIANYDKNGGTDWQDEIYRTAIIQNANLGVSGGTEKLKYLVSANFLDQEGILLNSNYTRFSLRSNFSAEITNWLDFGLNFSYTRENTKAPDFKLETQFVSQAVHNAVLMSPTNPVYNADGSYHVSDPQYAGAGIWNPVASAKEQTVDNPISRNNMNIFLNFKLLKGLSYKIMGGGNFASTVYRDYFNLLTKDGSNNNGFGNYNTMVNNRLQLTNILTYDNQFGAHHITFTGVAEEIKYTSQGSTMQGKNFLVNQLGYDNFGGAKFLTTGSSHQEHSQISYMGRVNYSLHDKYLATLSYRADGSSVFGSSTKWGYFPSGSIAWRLSQENFLKDSRIINNLKLRASYGVTGNQGIPPYSSLARLGSGVNYNYPFDGVSNNLGFGISQVANPNLKWESTAQGDIGVDVSLFMGRLTSTIDVYRKVTDNLLMNRGVPYYIGVSSVISNVGSVENKGLEFQVGGDPLVGKVKWNTSFNISINRNKVRSLGTGTPYIGYYATSGGYGIGADLMRLEPGQPFGLINGWKYLGMWSTDQTAEAAKYGQLPGSPHWLDVNNDGQIDVEDRTTIGKAYPKFTYGFTNTFTYNGLELSFLIIGSQGNDLFNTTRIARESQWGGNSPALMHPWTPENQGSNIPAVYDGAFLESQTQLVNKIFIGTAQGGATSRWVEDASYVKLKTVTLSYSFDKEILRSIGFTKSKVFVSGTNLLTFTKYTGYDPEAAAFASSDAMVGVDLGVYPPSKIITFGIDFTF